MSLETLRQNTETLIEVINNYEYLSNKRDQLSVSKNKKEIDELNLNLGAIRDYILKLLTRSDQIVEEIRNE